MMGLIVTRVRHKVVALKTFHTQETPTRDVLVVNY